MMIKEKMRLVLLRDEPSIKPKAGDHTGFENRFLVYINYIMVN